MNSRTEREGAVSGLRLPKRHFNALDFSRLIAACAVLFWHYQHFFVPPVVYEFHVRRPVVSPFYHQLAWAYDYGHVAVQYFWAVSGFVFAHVYLADRRAQGRFWLARVARLWPLHVLTLVLVALLQAAYVGRHGTEFIYHQQDWRHFVLSLFLAQYWGWQANQSFNGPSWSLSTEILAYAAFWLLLPALRRAPLLIALPVSAAMLWLFFKGVPDSAVLTCIGYFFGGAAVYGAALRSRIGSGGLVVLGLALALLAWHLTTLRDHGEDAAVLAGTFSVLLLMLAIDFADTRDVLRLGRRLGDASYGIYLWHFPLQLALVLIIDTTLGSRAIFRHGGFLVFFLTSAILLGFASHRWIERPAQRAILRLADRRRGQNNPGTA